VTDVLNDMKAILVAAGDAGTIELARLPDQPDAVLALRTYPAEVGRDPNGRMLPALERIAVQMVVRVAANAGEKAAMQRAWTAYYALANKHVTGASGQVYDWFIPNAVPAPLGYDPLDRPMVVVNWSIQAWGELAP